MWPFDQMRRLFGRVPETINTEAANDRQAVRDTHEALLERAANDRQAGLDAYKALLERAWAGVSKRPIRDAKGRFVKRRAF